MPPPEPFQWSEWKRRIPAILLLFPFIALTISGLAVGSDAYTQAKEYEAAATGTMEGYEGMSREDVDALRVREMRRAVAGWLLVPFGIVGIVAAFGELGRASWTRSAYRHAGVLGVVTGIVQGLLLWGQVGAMWTLGIFTGLFGAALAAYSMRRGLTVPSDESAPGDSMPRP